MAFLIIVLLSAFSALLKKLTAFAALTAAIIASMLYIGLGVEALVYLGIFFVSGVVATAHGKSKKRSLVTGTDNGPRTSSQVLANSGVPALLAFIAILDPRLQSLMSFLTACAFASACADTLSSELGMIYGSTNYNVISLKRDQRGLDGVVSVEGSLIGATATLLIAGPYFIFFDTGNSPLIIMVAGVLGNYSDSVLGATLERRKLLNNDVVNFLNTMIAAIIGFLLFQIFK